MTTRARLDCESAGGRRTVRVQARDNGATLRHNATASVQIGIVDVNDNAPQFEQSVYNVSVREDTPVGTCFLKVRLREETLHSPILVCPLLPPSS